jgi:predicted secreted hydrolase
MRRLILILGALALALVAAFYVWGQTDDEGTLSAQVVSTPVTVEGFMRADGSLSLEFPRDFGAHPDYRTEWWYYTGNLDTADGRHFGYELTFFRVSMFPPDQTFPRESNWAADQVYMAHFALTDVAGEQFYAFQRYSRGAVDLAGAEAAPYRSGWKIGVSKRLAMTDIHCTQQTKIWSSISN